MAETPGICTQTATCDVARSGRVITVPLATPFLCPECSRGLLPPVQATDIVVTQRMPAAVPLALVGAGLLVLGGAVFLGRELGTAGPAPVATQMLASVAPATVPGSAPAQPAAPISAAPAKIVIAASEPGSAPAAPKAEATALPDPMPVKPAGSGALPAAAVAAQSVSAPSSAAPPSTAVMAPVPVSLAEAAFVAATPASDAAPIPAAAAPNVPSIMAAAPQPVAPPLLAAQTAQQPSPIAAGPVAIAASTPVLADQPFSPVPIAGGAPAYPAELAADGRSGRVGVSCQISAEGVPAACHVSAGKGNAAFASAAAAWLAHAHVRYRPVILHGHAVAVARSWTFSIDEAPAMLAEARRKQLDAAKVEVAAAVPAPAPAPAVALVVQPVMARQVVAAPKAAAIDRPFSSHVLAGGAPAFPASYDESRPGAVTVGCMILENGAPSGCHIVKEAGGGAFGGSVQTWLGSGTVRFRPITAGGQPVARAASWTIVFNSVPQEN